jgi:hypothetical protein
MHDMENEQDDLIRSNATRQPVEKAIAEKGDRGEKTTEENASIYRKRERDMRGTSERKESLANKVHRPS